MELKNIIVSVNDSGMIEGGYSSFNYITQSTQFVGVPVSQRVDPFLASTSIINSAYVAPIILGSHVDVLYWNDPTMGSGYYIDNLSKVSIDGIPLVLEIPNCTGIFSKFPVSLSTWDENIKGIEIDKDLRPDMNFILGGDYNTFKNAIGTWSGGYWATGNDVKITLTDAIGTNLLYGGNTQTLKPLYWRYDSAGSFIINLIPKLDFSRPSGIETFNDPNFTVWNCSLNVQFFDKFGLLHAQKTFNFNIDPPNINGSISVNGGITKSISDINFTMSRDAAKGSETYTELHNVKKCKYDKVKNIIVEDPPFNYFNSNISSDIITINNTNLNRGDYCYISYEPLLNGIKPGIKGGIAYTNSVVNCKKHRYSIDNVSLNFMTPGVYSGVYGSNVIDLISEKNPYIYTNIANSGVLRVTFDINHEDWNLGLNYTDAQIYPCISTIYILAIPPSNFESYLTSFKSIYIPYDTAETYPNVELSISQINTLLGLNGVYSSSVSLGGTDPSLSSYVMQLTINKSNKYRVFIGVLDEYNQVSFWCITNKTNKFNIPF